MIRRKKQQLENDQYLTSLKDHSNPLVQNLYLIYQRILKIKNQAKEYYFEVLLSQHPCPSCGCRLEMIGPSQAYCQCGEKLDPTLVFQKSGCCNAHLHKRTFHYVCSKCRRAVPSRFLFDEKVFDRIYFKEAMQASRDRTKAKRDAIKQLLAESRSGRLEMADDPKLEEIPGLLQDLDSFVGAWEPAEDYLFCQRQHFDMKLYRKHILSSLSWSRIDFGKISPLLSDHRLDRIRRFVTLIFMQNSREVELTQYDQALWVQKIYHEIDTEG